MKQMTDVVACAIVFILVFDRGWQRLVLKFMKNDHFSVFLAAWPFLDR